MSPMVCQSGCTLGSHISMYGANSNGATTAVTGWRAEAVIASSVATSPNVISGCRYIVCAALWNPIAGPPARSSIRTPVGLPPWATSGPVTRLCAVSTRYPELSSSYRAPCSACGTHGVCTTTGSGQTPLRLTCWLAAAGAAPASLLAPPEQPLATSAIASVTITIERQCWPRLALDERLVKAPTESPPVVIACGGVKGLWSRTGLAATSSSGSPVETH